MKRFIKRVFLVLFTIILIGGSFLVYKGYREYKNVVAENSIETVVASIQNKKHYTRNEDINPLFLEAVVATEDERLYSRGTVLDYRALGRAFVKNITTFSLAEGGSTIPQQVAKNLYFPNNFTATRKVAEYFIASDLDKLYSREEILELYVNMNYYGDGHHGIREASFGYFNVNPKDMSRAQAAMLAGIPQSPAYYQLSSNYKGAKARQEHVLYRLVDAGVITQEEAISIFNEDVYGGNKE